MKDGVFTGRKEGDADARRRTLEAIRQRAVAMLGDSVEVIAQVEEVGLAIEALSLGHAFGSEPAVRVVRWTILA